MTNTEIVNNFISSWEARDVDAIMAFFSESAIYHNIPMPKLTGHQQILGFIAPFIANTEKVFWEVLHSAENAAGSVLTERLDHFVLKTGQQISIPVMGTFEVVDGKITAWRDYFDLKTFMDQKM